MAWEEIARGTNANLDQVAYYENMVPENNRARLDLHTAAPVPTFQMDALRNSMVAAGVTEVQMTGSGSLLQITYRKGAFWIPLIIALVAALAIVVMLWILFKEVAGVIGGGPATFMIVAGAILALAVSYSLVRRNYT
jgi:hypothetical protein